MVGAFLRGEKYEPKKEPEWTQQDTAETIRWAVEVLHTQVRVLLGGAVELGKSGEYREVVRTHDQASTLERAIEILNELAYLTEHGPDRYAELKERMR